MTKAGVARQFDEACPLGRIVDFSGVEDFIDTPVKRYSSGMVVRLAFAVAAHPEPASLRLTQCEVAQHAATAVPLSMDAVV